jgi:hypothetical protein
MSQDTLFYNIAGWVVFLLIGGVIAFSLYAILSGRKQNKEYFDLSLPSINEDGADPTKANNLESLSMDDVVKTDDDQGEPLTAPLPVPDELPVPDSMTDVNDREDLNPVAREDDSESMPVPDLNEFEYAGDQPQSYGGYGNSLPIPSDDDHDVGSTSQDDPISSIDNMMESDEDAPNPFSL